LAFTFKDKNTMGPFTAFMSVDHDATDKTATAPTTNWIAGLVASVRRSLADERMREQLADMDVAMLRDIGVADDEIHKIRARDHFTPRAWAERRSGYSA
jgi:uncharacterized protein YjiS (DUF1127 family)